MVERHVERWMTSNRRSGGPERSRDRFRGTPGRAANGRELDRRSGSNNPQHERASDPADDGNHWPDVVFRVALVVWLVLGLTAILRATLADRSSVPQVLAVAWGVLVIFVLWFRLGPPRDRDNAAVLR